MLRRMLVVMVVGAATLVGCGGQSDEVKAAVASCKQSVQSAPQLKADTVSELEDLCEKAGDGDVEDAKKAARGGLHQDRRGHRARGRGARPGRAGLRASRSLGRVAGGERALRRAQPPCVLDVRTLAAVATRRVKVSGGELFADVEGEGPPVVLLHSGVCDGRQWEAVAQLVQRRMTVVRYDRRGYGRSAKYKRGRYSAALDLLELLDGLGLDRVVGCGNSAGGEALLEAAAIAPRALRPARPARAVLRAVGLRPRARGLRRGRGEGARVRRPRHRRPPQPRHVGAPTRAPRPGGDDAAQGLGQPAQAAVSGVLAGGPAGGGAARHRSPAPCSCSSASTTTRRSAASPGTWRTGCRRRPPRRSPAPGTCSGWRLRSWSPAAL